jgi:hypothetical protein
MHAFVTLLLVLLCCSLLSQAKSKPKPLPSCSQLQAIPRPDQQDPTLSRIGVGAALSANGHIMVAAAPFYGVTNYGALFVYAQSSSSSKKSKFIVVQTITPPESMQIEFSTDISGNGNVIIAGASGYDYADGAVLVYQSAGIGTYNYQATILPPTDYYNFGQQVRINQDGTVALISSIFVAVGLYTFENEAWTLTSTFHNPAPNGIPDYPFGSAIALSDDGTVVLIGDPSFSSDTGTVYAYRLIFGGLVPLVLVPPNNIPNLENAQQGFSVALSGDGYTAVVGAPTYNGGAGASFVYTYVSGTGNSWIFRQVLQVLCPKLFPECNQGASVAASSDGSVIVVGAATNSIFDYGAGSTTVYKRNTLGEYATHATVVGTYAKEANQGTVVDVSANGEDVLVIGVQGEPYAWIFGCS